MKSLFYLLPLIILLSCVKDKPLPASSAGVTLSNSAKVYVLNEGNFGSGNASVSLFDPESGEVVEDFYKNQNHSGLGDVIQSIKEINHNFYLVVNHSSKIVVCDRNFKKLTEIKGLASPRYMVEVTPNTAYVSDLSNNGLHLLDLNNNQVIGTIPLKGWTEQMVLIFNKVFVTNIRSQYTFAIDPITNTVTDSVWVGPNAASLVLDKENKIWVLSSGDQASKTPARISRINTLNATTDLTIELGGYSATNLQISGSGDTLYFLNNNLYRLIPAVSQVAEIVVPHQGRNYYGLGIHPRTGEIYLADALDFSQRSNIYIYNSTGVQKQFFKAGINSNGFYFE